jgi:hypothetical protein
MSFYAPAQYGGATEYEIAWELPDGRRKVFGYSAQRTKSALLRWAKVITKFILEHADENLRPSYDRSTGWNFGGVRVFFSGGTMKHPSDLPR